MFFVQCYFFILLSIISVKHQNMNNFWQNYFLSAYYHLIWQNLTESFSRLSKVARKKNIFSKRQIVPERRGTCRVQPGERRPGNLFEKRESRGRVLYPDLIKQNARLISERTAKI